MAEAFTAEEIKKLRERAGLNQREFALDLGLKVSQTISYWETGKMRPGSSMLAELRDYKAYLDYKQLLEESGQWPEIEREIESLRLRVRAIARMAALFAVLPAAKFKELVERRRVEILGWR